MPRPVRRARAIRAGLLASLVLAASTAIPVAHAYAEQVVAEAAFEAHHSDCCPTLHVDALCPTCHVGNQLAPTVATRVPLDRPAELNVPVGFSDRLPPAADGCRPDSARAPPAA